MSANEHEAMDCEGDAEPLLKDIAHNCTLSKSTRCAYCELGLNSIFSQDGKLSQNLAQNVKEKVKASFDLIDGN